MRDPPPGRAVCTARTIRRDTSVMIVLKVISVARTTCALTVARASVTVTVTLVTPCRGRSVTAVTTRSLIRPVNWPVRMQTRPASNSSALGVRIAIREHRLMDISAIR
uniref:Uncharacterized protein n=1 Tax=Cacopsylla melanoneura TaxID=428564 RepID=A0A8D8SM27_9HEMI